MKIICKALTTRLQAQIADVIDVDQSGFIAGRSISENFVYATEMVQCCFKRRAPTLVLKLDFAKAFDSIDWGSLRRALLARGFPPLWCDWMDAIFHSSKSAVVLNGVPGRWINCKRGLRQGDPLSPYLFLIVADILQQLVKQDGVLQHPLVDGRPPLVLQYADDTLIILRAEPGAAERLKGILDDFAAATGLVINFSKSTLVPMSLDPEALASAAEVLGCVVEGFPQTYLGLPLSCDKLALEAFAPLIGKADKYLSGWRALLLSPAGRLVLVNAVLDSLPTHAMAALQLPPSVIAALDALRRAFLWGVGDERASGAKCLVAWDKVCRPKDEGGLGVRALGLQNACLLVKLLHRLHIQADSPWAAWRWTEIGDRSIVAGPATSSGGHWAALRRLMPLYRCLTRVEIGDGGRTSFWHDDWLPGGPLSISAAALYSHTTSPEATVAQALAGGIDSILAPRLSRVGARELDSLRAALDEVALGDGADRRSLTRCSGPRNKLITGALYRLCNFGGVSSANAGFIWRCHAPSRVRFFGWLLTLSRVQTRDTLLRKTIVDAAGAGCPLCDATLETASHMTLHCPVAARFWSTIGVEVQRDFHVRDLHLLPMPSSISMETAPAFALLCCWQLWKQRNAAVFRGAAPSPSSLNCAGMMRPCGVDGFLIHNVLISMPGIFA
jgi:hypothetical protein